MDVLSLSVPEKALKEASRYLRFSAAPFLGGVRGDPNLQGHAAIRIQVGRNLVLGRMDAYRLVQVSLGALPEPVPMQVAWVDADALLGYLATLRGAEPRRKPEGYQPSVVRVQMDRETLTLEADGDRSIQLPLTWMEDTVWQSACRLFAPETGESPEYTAVLDTKALQSLRRLAKGHLVTLTGIGDDVSVFVHETPRDPGTQLLLPDGDPLVVGAGCLSAVASADLLDVFTKFPGSVQVYALADTPNRPGVLVAAGGSVRMLLAQALLLAPGEGEDENKDAARPEEAEADVPADVEGDAGGEEAEGE